MRNPMGSFFQANPRQAPTPMAPTMGSALRGMFGGGGIAGGRPFNGIGTIGAGLLGGSRRSPAGGIGGIAGALGGGPHVGPRPLGGGLTRAAALINKRGY